MELVVVQEKLAKALAAAGRIAGHRTELPVLNNILLRTDGGRLLVAATDLEIASTQHIGANISRHGQITVPARLVGEFVANLPKGNVTLRADGDHLHISAGGYSSTIHGVSADEFPELPTIDSQQAIQYQLAAVDLKQAISQTIVAASHDSTRPVLTGVYWHTHDGELYLAATDGYRLAERRLATVQSQVQAIVPVVALQEALRALDDTTTEIEVLLDETQIRLRIQDIEITSRLIDGNFPDYRQLIPSNSQTEITVDRDELVRIVKIASLFARQSGGSIMVTANSDSQTLSVHAVASELGENTSEASATVTADGIITLNPRYVTEALSALDGDQIVVRFQGPLAPCVLTALPDKPNYQHIIMPLRQ